MPCKCDTLSQELEMLRQDYQYLALQFNRLEGRLKNLSEPDPTSVRPTSFGLMDPPGTCRPVDRARLTAMEAGVYTYAGDLFEPVHDFGGEYLDSRDP